MKQCKGTWLRVECVLIAEFKLRCPGGRKTKLYKRARLEKFAEYVMKDGLVCRLSVYDDNNSQFNVTQHVNSLRVVGDGVG